MSVQPLWEPNRSAILKTGMTGRKLDSALDAVYTYRMP